MTTTNNVISMKGIRELPRNAPKSVRSNTEAVILTQEAVRAWKAPSFQRPLRVNGKVLELVDLLKTNGGILPGILTIGILDREKYEVDGQHRTEAFKLSELAEVYAEIRICHFETYADMAAEFVMLNSRLVTMRPDDLLRGFEPQTKSLAKIRRHCDFVGYDMVRRGAATPILSMSVVIRCWFASTRDVPATGSGSALALVDQLTEEETDRLIVFLNAAYQAWGRDSSYFRLWGSLNLAVAMWLWRRTVIDGYSQKSVRLAVPEFTKCMMALSTDGGYLDWLTSRNLTERDRAPCFARMKSLFAKRLELESHGKKIIMPAPAWAHG